MSTTVQARTGDAVVGVAVGALFTGIGVAAAGGVTAVSWPLLVGLFLAASAATAVALAGRQRRHEHALSSCADVISAMADGDLTRTFSAGATGQLAAVAAATERLVQQLRLSLTTIDRARDLLKTGVTDVHELSLAMSSTSETVAAKAYSVATAASQVTSHVHAVAASAEELATTIRSVAQHASDASNVANSAAHEADSANSTVAELHAASARVESIVRLITSIAGQTHLLALNATIEAARAGEAGRGFAVVADEVKQLARETAAATEQVSRSLHDIQSGSADAAGVMGRITVTIGQVSDNQNAIAAAVEEQTVVTQEIGRNASAVAHGADDMSDSITALADVARVTAYGGAQARTTAAALADIQTILAEITSTFRFDVVELDAEVGDDTRYAAITADGVTTIQDAVVGTDVNELNYAGRWEHSTGNVESGGTNSYSSMPGDTMTVRFTGRQLRFFGVKDANHGIAAVSVDGGAETLIDEFSATRETGALLFESATLAPGQHTFTFRVTGTCNPLSRYTWVTVDRVEIVE